MIIYEVNITVDRALDAAYCEWLESHIQDVLATPGFVEAKWYSYESSADAGDTRDTRSSRYCVHYFVKNETSLREYFNTRAPQLRAEAKEKFGDRFSATRRVLIPRAEAAEVRGRALS